VGVRQTCKPDCLVKCSLIVTISRTHCKMHARWNSATSRGCRAAKAHRERFIFISTRLLAPFRKIMKYMRGAAWRGVISLSLFLSTAFSFFCQPGEIRDRARKIRPRVLNFAKLKFPRKDSPLAGNRSCRYRIAAFFPAREGRIVPAS